MRPFRKNQKAPKPTKKAAINRWAIPDYLPWVLSLGSGAMWFMAFEGHRFGLAVAPTWFTLLAGGIFIFSVFWAR